MPVRAGMAGVLVVLVAFATGCGGDVVTAQDAAPPVVIPTSSAPSAAPQDTPGASDHSTIGVYTAVLRHLIEPGGLGRSSTADQVFVLDATSANPESERPGEALDARARAAIRAAVGARPPIRWVSDADTVRTPDRVGMKRGGRMIVTLGTIQDAKDHVLVEYAMWCGNLCGFGTTLVVEQHDKRWKVTRETGGSWVS